MIYDLNFQSKNPTVLAIKFRSHRIDYTNQAKTSMMNFTVHGQIAERLTSSPPEIVVEWCRGEVVLYGCMSVCVYVCRCQCVVGVVQGKTLTFRHQ